MIISMSTEVWEQDAVRAARALIGYRFYVEQSDGTRVGGMICETEAYTPKDAASHSFHGKTPRTAVMFDEPGHLYVYFTYGMHWCVNIVTSPIGSGEAVLLRALMPDQGLSIMRTRRSGKPDAELTNGPAKLCQALDITGKDSSEKLNESRFILLPPNHQIPHVIATKRIGISRDTHRLWRFIVVE
jgi:DNA-3-methyladenine glycosylase